MSDYDETFNEAIRKVDQFIQRMHDFDIEIKLKDREEKMVADALGVALKDYGNLKHSEILRQVMAVDALNAINMAFAWGIVKPSEAIFRKYNEFKEENAKLKEAIQKLQEDKVKLKEKLDKCEGRLEEFEKKYLPQDSSQSEVEVTDDESG